MITNTCSVGSQSPELEDTEQNEDPIIQRTNVRNLIHILDTLKPMELIGSTQGCWGSWWKFSPNHFLSLAAVLSSKRKDTDVVYWTFSKVFVKDSHRILLEKLDAHTWSGALSSGWKNWLGGRGQGVLVNGFTSSSQIMTSEVPQGSVLESALFKIFINDWDKEIDQHSFGWVLIGWSIRKLCRGIWTGCIHGPKPFGWGPIRWRVKQGFYPGSQHSHATNTTIEAEWLQNCPAKNYLGVLSMSSIFPSG